MNKLIKRRALYILASLPFLFFVLSIIVFVLFIAYAEFGWWGVATVILLPPFMFISVWGLVGISCSWG